MKRINYRDLLHVSLLPHSLIRKRSIVCTYILQCLCLIACTFEQGCTKFKPQEGEEDVVLQDELRLSRELMGHLTTSHHLYSNIGHQAFQTQNDNNDNPKNESTTSASVNGVTPSTFTRDLHLQDIVLPGEPTLTSPPQKEVGNRRAPGILPRKRCDSNASERQCSQESPSDFDANPFSSCSSGSADDDRLSVWCQSVAEPTLEADSRSTNSSVDSESVGASSPSPSRMAVSQSLSTNSSVDDISVGSSSSGLSSSNTMTDDEQHDEQTQPSFLGMLRSVLNNDLLQTLSELDISHPLYFLSAARDLYSENKANDDDTPAMLFQMQRCAFSLHFIPASERRVLLGIQDLPFGVDKFFLLTSQIVRRHRSLFLSSSYKEYKELGVGTVFEAIGFEFYLLKTLLETQYSYEVGGQGFQFDDIICFMITALVAADNISFQEENIDKEVKDVDRDFRQNAFKEYNMLPPNDKYSFQFVGFAFIQFLIGDVYDGVDTLEVIERGVPTIADLEMFSTLIIQATAVDGDGYTNGAVQPPPQTMMVPQDQGPQIQQGYAVPHHSYGTSAAAAAAAATQSFATTASPSPRMHATTGQPMYHPQLNHHDSYGSSAAAATPSHFATTAPIASPSPRMHATTGQPMVPHQPQGIGEYHPQLNHHDSYGSSAAAATPSHFATTASIASLSPRMHATTGQPMVPHQPQGIGEYHPQLNHHDSYGSSAAAATPSHFATTASIASLSPRMHATTGQSMFPHQPQLPTVSGIGEYHPQLNYSASAPPDLQQEVGLNNSVGGATTMETSATMYPQVTNGVPSDAFGLHHHQPQMNRQASQGGTASDEPAVWMRW